MNKINNLKCKLKQMAKEIREVRRAEKEFARNGGTNWIGPQEYESLDTLTSMYRHAHIAYCLLRGRTYEQIEPMVRPGNEPYWPRIEKIQETGIVPESTKIFRHGNNLTAFTWKTSAYREIWDQEYAKLKKLERENAEMRRTTKEAASMMDTFIKNFWKLLS